MRITILAAIVGLVAAVVTAGTPPDNTKTSPAFDRLKGLTGSWEGKDPEGKRVTITYKVVSAGTSLMETLDMGEDKEAMVTMYHLDGDKLIMTHYCSMGNQPRMRAKKMPKDGNTISFTYVDGTNMTSVKDSHMHNLVFTFKDDDHFSQEWTMWKDGKADHTARFEFERAK